MALFHEKIEKLQKSFKNQHFYKIVLKENVCIFSKVTWIKVCCFYSMFSNLLIFHVETTLDWCVDTDLWKKHHCWQGATFHVLFTSRIWKLEQFGTIPHPISLSSKMLYFSTFILALKIEQTWKSDEIPTFLCYFALTATSNLKSIYEGGVSTIAGFFGGIRFFFPYNHIIFGKMRFGTAIKQFEPQ